MLGRDVTGRAEDGECPCQVARGIEPLGEAEVADQRFTLAVEEDVAGFQVAMENSLPMRVLHGARDLRDQPNAFARLVTQGRPDFLQAPARRVFHAEVGHAFVGLAYFVDRENVGMIETGRGFGFAPETRQRLARIGVITQDPFQGHDPAGMPLPRAVDDSHPAAPDLFQDFVVPQPPLRIWDRYLVERLREPHRVRTFGSDSRLQQAAEAETVRNARGGVTIGAFPGRRRDRRQRICQPAEVHGRLKD